MREIASLKLNMKVCDAIPGTLNVVSEENAAISENNRFTESNVAFFFAELGLNSTSCGLLKIVCPEICFNFLIYWSLVKP